MTISSDFYNFTSGLIAYWGASILFNFSISRELQTPFKIGIKKPVFFLPFLLYGVYCIIIMIFIRPYLGALFVPILIYGLTLSLTLRHGFGSVLARQNNPEKTFCHWINCIECNGLAHWHQPLLFKERSTLWGGNFTLCALIIFYLYVL